MPLRRCPSIAQCYGRGGCSARRQLIRLRGAAFAPGHATAVMVAMTSSSSTRGRAWLKAPISWACLSSGCLSPGLNQRECKPEAVFSIKSAFDLVAPLCKQVRRENTPARILEIISPSGLLGGPNEVAGSIDIRRTYQPHIGHQLKDIAARSREDNERALRRRAGKPRVATPPLRASGLRPPTGCPIELTRFASPSIG
jgi:hypothetical protein